MVMGAVENEGREESDGWEFFSVVLHDVTVSANSSINGIRFFIECGSYETVDEFISSNISHI